MANIPAASAISGAATQGAAKTLFEDQRTFITQLPGGNALSTLTIASDQVTPTRHEHKIDTEGAAATDDLKQILTTNLPDGSELRVSIVSAARKIRINHAAGGTGQMSLISGDHFWLGDPTHYVVFKRNGSTWEERDRLPSADFAPHITQTGNYTITQADRGRQLIQVSGNGTWDLLSTTQAGRGWLLSAMNRGAGILTLDANGGDLIDELATLTLFQNESGLFQSDGGGRWITIARSRLRPPRGYLHGLTLSNAPGDTTNDIRVAIGECASSDVSVEDRMMMTLTSAFDKQIDAVYASGSGAGGRVGSLADGTWHVYLFRRGSDGVFDVFMEQSLTPTAPDSGTHVRWLGSFLRESSANAQFTQDGDYFELQTMASSIAANNPGTSAVTRTIRVPTGIRVRAKILVNVRNTGTAGSAVALISALSSADQAPATNQPSQTSSGQAGTGHTQDANAEVEVYTNTSAQVRSRLSFSDASTNLNMWVRGWYTDRGRTS